MYICIGEIMSEYPDETVYILHEAKHWFMLTEMYIIFIAHDFTYDYT